MPENLCTKVGEGVIVEKFYHEVDVSSAITREPRPEDVFVVTYFSRSGGDLAQTIIHNILRGTQPPSALKVPQPMQVQGRPASVLTHLPFGLTFRSDRAKYIYIARNPYHCSVLFYEQTLNYEENSTEDALEGFPGFFEDFINGDAPCGDYLGDVLSWYERRFDDNVLFLTYEELVDELKTTVLRIADFLDEEGEHGQKLRRNRKLLEKICAEIRCHVDQESAQRVTTLKEATVAEDCARPHRDDRLRKSENFVVARQLLLENIEEGKPQRSISAIFTLDMVNQLQHRVKAVAGGNCRVVQLWRSCD